MTPERSFKQNLEGAAADDETAVRMAALNATVDAVVITDKAGIIQWANASLKAITGYDVADVVGLDSRDVFSSEAHSPEFFEEMWSHIQGGEAWRGELINLRKDGSAYPEEQTITPVRSRSGEITHFVSVKRDLTEKKLMEAKYLQAQKMECIGRLAAGIAHDFNNIIMVVNGTADCAAMDLNKGDPLLADLLEIQKAGQRAAGLTRQLLAFSRKQVTDRQPTNLGQLVRNLRGMLSRLLSAEIELVIGTDDDAWTVMADPSQMEQILFNLAANARDAMLAGGTLSIRIENITIPEAPCPQQIVRLTATDNGTGMSPSVTEHIFEPFFTTKGVGKGTGLGLSTVYGIVQNNGGRITVESEVGIGTCFTIDFPAVSSAAEIAEPALEITPAPEGASVLIVEDQPSLLMLTRKMLRLAGYQVHIAANGPEALAVLRGPTPVDLLLTDVVMPDMGGRDLALRALIARPHLKVVYMTGYTDDIILSEGRVESGSCLLHKPFTAAQLTSVCRGVLNGSQREAYDPSSPSLSAKAT